MSFLQTEFISKEIRQIEFLQELVQGLDDSYEDSDGSLEIRVEYWHALYALVEKQHVVYTRLMYTTDYEAVKLKKNLEETARGMGLGDDSSMSDFYVSMKEDIKDAIEDLTGEDLNRYEGIDIDFI